jgi:polysaccharide biosynthesis/export protein
MNRRTFCIRAIIPALLLWGCSSPRFEGRPGLEIVRQAPLPEPSRTDMVIPGRPYVVGPSDQLVIDVFGIPEFSKTLTVDLTGQIALPMVGSLDVSGLTVRDLTALITERLRNAHIRQPIVTVNLTTAANQVITVDGAVATPGIYPLVGRMSLVRAIARASGTTEFARENYVVVFRTADGKRYAALYDLRAIRQGLYDDPEVFSNDVIYVGDSQARRIFKDVVTAAPLITTPLLYLFR